MRWSWRIVLALINPMCDDPFKWLPVVRWTRSLEVGVLPELSFCYSGREGHATVLVPKNWEKLRFKLKPSSPQALRLDMTLKERGGYDRIAVVRNVGRNLVAVFLRSKYAYSA